MSGQYLYVPIENAIKPCSGESICNSYWMVTEDNEICFWTRKKGIALEASDLRAQCNTDEGITKLLIPACDRSTDKILTSVFLECVFVQSCADYLVAEGDF